MLCFLSAYGMVLLMFSMDTPLHLDLSGITLKQTTNKQPEVSFHGNSKSTQVTNED